MDQSQKDAIVQFAKSIDDLKKTGVIRSHRYLGDIGEFLCADAFGINLANNLREVNIDGTRGQRTVQIKYNGGQRTNIDAGDPTSYDELYVVIGNNSVMYPKSSEGDYLIYYIAAKDLVPLVNEKGKCYCSMGTLPQKPMVEIFLSDQKHPSEED